jgi:N-formylmaleamate deformylase
MAKLYYGSAMSDGIRIQYYRTGEEKPPLVLLHGITDNGLCWNRTALMLEPDFDVVMIDARGHGLSDAPDSGYDYDQQARDVVAVIEELGLGTPVVMGHSMGAQAAAILAASYPHLVRAIILEDPPWEAQEQTMEARRQWGANLEANVTAFQAKSEAELMEAGRNIHPTWEAGEIQIWARAKKQVRPEVAHIIDTPRPRWQDFVPQIQCPVLLITGNPDQGGLVTLEVAEQVARILKKCYVVNVPGAGHNIRRDQFYPFFDAVCSFLGIS